MTTEARELALSTLDATKAVIEALNEAHHYLHELRDSRHNTGAQEVAVCRKIGAAEDMIRHGFKTAEINALVYVGDQVHALREAVVDRPIVLTLPEHTTPDNETALLDAIAEYRKAHSA